jgi:hypothetical protein
MRGGKHLFTSRFRPVATQALTWPYTSSLALLLRPIRPTNTLEGIPMKVTRAFSLALIVAAIAACQAKTDETATENAPATEPGAAPAAPAPSTEPVMSADVKGEGGADISGKVEILPSADATNAFRVRVNLEKVPAGEHAWHIHQGACGAKDTPVVVPFTEDKDKPALSTPITAAADGTVNVEADVPGNLLTVDQLRSGDYSLHVHQKTGTNHGPTIACATL